jgi:valyl-tRNA synthetase
MSNRIRFGPSIKLTYDATIDFFERLMKLAHPFMPFITEEIWQEISERIEPAKASAFRSIRKRESVDISLLADFEMLFEIISTVRNVRNSKQINPKTELPLAIKSDAVNRFKPLESLIRKLAVVSDISYVSEKADGLSFMIKSVEFFVNIAGEIDVEQERANIEKELAYTKGFLESVLKKLSNEKFVANAKPDVIDRERQKLADAEAKIKTLEENLATL